MILEPNENVMKQALHFGSDSMALVAISTLSLELYGLETVPRKQLMNCSNLGCRIYISRAVSLRPNKSVNWPK